jgi:glycosyltransferase involved in cell wall biosynthesis/2-polyprenyl-3-methyl-5-hydroxy-6-metoxy-1,4-benzoquinol methylase
MNVLYVAASEFAGNNAIHALSVARVMQARGFACAVTFRTDDNNVRPRGAWPFLICDHRETAHNGVLFPDGRGPDLIHAWTPREHVRSLTERMAERYRCPYIVHLEDNEEVILADALGSIDYGELAALPARVTDEIIPPYFSHPKRYRWFLEGAAGVTALIDKLMDFKPDGIPGAVFWPGFETGILTANGSRKEYGIGDDETVLVYNGNIHRSNEAEVISLIDGVGLLRERGVPVTLVKTGANHAGLEKLKEAGERGFLIDLGFVERAKIHSLLNLADVLVQPGHESAFNDFRFPCKLPELLATGKPVVLPNANLGRYLRDGKECLLMETGDAEEIAGKVESLLRNRELGKRIGKGGREFALQRLDWERNLEPVLELYSRVANEGSQAGRHPRADPPPVQLERVTATAEKAGEAYLGMAVTAVAHGSWRVVQRTDGDPWLYQKWLAATMERALTRRCRSIEIEGWREEEHWIAATGRGYAAGMGSYLRRKGIPISDLALERTLRQDTEDEKGPPKTPDRISEEELTRMIGPYGGHYERPAISCAADAPWRWAVKTILGMVPRGGRVLEIGGGDPRVAAILSRAGYEVWIFDSFGGSANGPLEMERSMREHAAVRFVCDSFSDQALDIPRGSFDCIYSVSALKHFDERGLLGVARGIAKFLKPGGVSIHAIDSVQRLELLAALFKIDDVDLRAILRSASLPNVSLQLVTDGRSVARSLAAVDRP